MTKRDHRRYMSKKGTFSPSKVENLMISTLYAELNRGFSKQK
jgi:hypothetical protein